MLKYASIIYGHTPQHEFASSTGFFVLWNHKYYLVSAMHVFTTWDPMHYLKEPGPYPDTLFVRVINKTTHTPDFLPIDIRALKNESHTKGIYENISDVFIYQINIPKRDTVYSIETLINNYSPAFRMPRELFVVGFPKRLGEANYSTLYRPASMAVIQPIVDVDKPMIWGVANKATGVKEPKIDSVDYICRYPESQVLGPGNSGSPVFLFIPNENRIVFYGVCFGGDASNHTTYIAKPLYVRSIFDKLSK